MTVPLLNQRILPAVSNQNGTKMPTRKAVMKASIHKMNPRHRELVFKAIWKEKSKCKEEGDDGRGTKDTVQRTWILHDVFGSDDKLMVKMNGWTC
jgi:hypothetical protein